MSEPTPAYAHLLKRRPAQARSAQRVEAILDATAGLLAGADPAALGIRDIAGAAGVPTGTIYQFFEDKDAVLQALAARFIDGMPDVMDAALGRRATTWGATLDHVVGGFAAMVREHPAIRRLWLSGALDEATRRREQAVDADLASRLGALLRDRAGSTRGRPHQWRTLVALIDGLLRHAFALDEAGDEDALREVRRAARAYAAAVLGVPDDAAR